MASAEDRNGERKPIKPTHGLRMKVPIAVLCDAASVREGLLHILGAGVSRVGRPDLPAPMGLQLALLINFEQTEGGKHLVEVRLQDPDEQVLGFIQGGFVADGPWEFPDLPLSAPLAVPLDTFVFHRPGMHQVNVLIDDKVVAELQVKVSQLPSANIDDGQTIRESATPAGP